MKAILIDHSAQLRYEKRVFARSVVFAVVLHVGAIGFLLAGQTLFNTVPEQPAIMSVGLAGAQTLSGSGGKKTKAPVMRKAKAPPKKKVTKKKTRKKKKKKKPNKNEIGLNTKKKAKKKTKKVEESSSSSSPAVEPGKKAVSGGTGGADETGISFQVGGSQSGTNVEDLPYLAYLQSVQYELSQRWARSGLSGGMTVVTFRINKDGSIQDAEISQSSGKRHLDSPALRAVLAARLPPLPQGCPDDYLIMHYQFHYRKE
ncbi:MAG: hypothetical protein CR997_08730 [Acidobacteria bacterium]|nr:MAG: hypothetical protein CR997_08730 [Acidobacteriota bacterium]